MMEKRHEETEKPHHDTSFGCFMDSKCNVIQTLHKAWVGGRKKKTATNRRKESK